MAPNPHELPPSKRFKILNSEQMSRPLSPTNEDDWKSLPAKKRSEIFNSSSTSARLPAKKGTEILNCSFSSSCLPAKKRVEILNCPSTSACLPAPSTSADLPAPSTSAPLPAKKRAEVLNFSSTSICLPAKKRVWVPHPLSPTKSETQAQDADSVLEEKGRIKDEDASNGVPVKKRAWARCLLSPTETETEGNEEANRLPAKKRVWIQHLLTPALLKAHEDVPNLKSVREKDQINEQKEVKEIHGGKKRVSAPNPLSATQEVTVKKRVWMEHPLTPAFPEEATNPEPVQQKDPINNAKVKEINGGKKRVSAPNPLSAIQEVTVKKRVLMEHPLTPALLGIEDEVTNLKPVHEKDQIKDLKQAKEIRGLTPKKRVWAPNLLSLTNTQPQTQCTDSNFDKENVHIKDGKAIHEAPLRKRVCAVRPLSPIAEENDQTEYQTKRAKEISPVLAKRRIWAPEPLVPAKAQIKKHTEPKPVKLGAENEFQTKDGDKICGVSSMHTLSPAKTETENQNEEKGPESIEEDMDDGVLCAVCQSTDGDPSDPIVFCDGCDLMVHASCYGNPLIKSIPEGDWFCSVCSLKPSQKEKRCCLCPVRGGALKPTVEGKWAHVMCALLVPEVFFQDPEGRDGIDCSRVPHKRWQKDCFLCGRNYGCAIDCAESKCKLGFHVSCGLEESLCIEYREGKEGDIVAGFCTEHTKLWKKQQLTGKFRIVSSYKDTKRKTD